MEEQGETANTGVKQSRRARVIACFEQPQTISILNYLKVENRTVQFQSLLKEQKKKGRDFLFDSIFVRQRKMRHILAGEASGLAQALISGRDQTLLLYGVEESLKQKLLFGEPRNSGMVLLFMEQLFQHCHRMKLEQRVTIKLSFASYEKGRFHDLLVNSRTPLKLCRDIYHKNYILGQSEIIVRNLKTAVKMIRIATSNSLANDHDDELRGECVIFQVKLEIESDKASERYQISKFKLVKFSDPSLSYSRKGGETLKINDGNRWAINLDNCLRERWMLDQPPNKNLLCRDDLIAYLRPVIQGETEICCYIALTNKLSQNDCLNCLIFSYYVSKIECTSVPTILDINELRQRIHSTEADLIPTLQDLAAAHPEFKIFELERLLKGTMERSFQLECEFSKLLSGVCSLLSKYVINEDVQEFFYCKKQGLKGSLETVRLLELILNNQERFQTMLQALLQTSYVKALGRAKVKAIQRLFELYRTACLYFFYQRHELFSRGTEGRKSILRNSRKSIMQRSQSRQSIAEVPRFDANTKPYATQQNIRARKVKSKPIRAAQKEPALQVSPSNRLRPESYEDYVKAMFFNESISAW